MFRTDYCGYNVHNPDRDTIYRPAGSGDYLFLHITSKMSFYFKDGDILTEKEASEGDCILFTPGTMQYYQAKGRFSNSFIHFSCDPGEIQGMQIPMNEIFHPANDDEILSLIKAIQVEYLSKKMRREKMIDLMIRELLIEIERSMYITADEGQQMDLYAELSRFRVDMLRRCEEEWDIERICKEVHLGRTQLYHYYRGFFFTTPKEDLISARIDKAKHLLSNHELRISDVSEQSGFTNIYHFNRYFKRVCGVTPGEYRRG